MAWDSILAKARPLGNGLGNQATRMKEIGGTVEISFFAGRWHAQCFPCADSTPSKLGFLSHGWSQLIFDRQLNLMSQPIRIAIVEDDAGLRELLAEDFQQRAGFSGGADLSGWRDGVAGYSRQSAECGADGHQPSGHVGH